MKSGHEYPYFDASRCRAGPRGRYVTSLAMSSKVQYSVDSSVATIVLDDGKVNVLSPAMQDEIHDALDSA